MSGTTYTQPTVYLMIGGSAIARGDDNEILETVEFLPDGKPDWSEAGVCDHRGAGGQAGFGALSGALARAEENARLAGFDPVPVREEPVA